ncbi:MAG: hypothetical protein VB856_03175, partial [Rhodospirillales bacterium]
APLATSGKRRVISIDVARYLFTTNAQFPKLSEDNPLVSLIQVNIVIQVLLCFGCVPGLFDSKYKKPEKQKKISFPAPLIELGWPPNTTK